MKRKNKKGGGGLKKGKLRNKHFLWMIIIGR